MKNEKLYYLLCVTISYLISFLLFRYALVIFLPFVIAYVFAWMIRPIVRFLHRYFRLNEKLSAIISILSVGILVVTSLLYILKQLLRQLIGFVSGLSCDKSGMEAGVKNICGCIEAFAEAGDGIIGKMVWKYMGRIDGNAIAEKILNSSICKAVVVGKAAFILVLAMFATYYILAGKKENNEKQDKKMYSENILHSEVLRIKNKIYMMGVSYLKAQFILFIIITTVCYAGFYFAGTGYPLLLAIVSGALDALPMIGVSVIIVPLIAYFLVKYKFISVLVLLICLVLCYCIREILEPRIMGRGIGLSPLCTMICMYVGFYILGISGVVTGPFAYIVAEEIKKILLENRKVEYKCQIDGET